MLNLKKFLVILITSSAVTFAEESKRYQILSFGGNGNIGSAVLSQILDTLEADVTVCSRGSWHWDSEKRIAPRVQLVKCNRKYEPACAAETNKTEECDINALRQCPDLMQVIETTEKFDIVLDFSG